MVGRRRAATLPDAKGPPQAIIRLAAVWVRVAAIAAVLLGLKAGFLHEDLDGERLWAAAGIAIAGVAGATMAVWRRREGWAFCAALGVNLAASLVVWHVEEMRHLPFDLWWLRLMQANVIASAVVALIWLAAHRRLYQLGEGEAPAEPRKLVTNAAACSARREPRPPGIASPLLALQIALPIVAGAAILFVPVVALVQDPRSLPAWMHDFAGAPGWLSLLLPAAAGAWYVTRNLPGKLVHVLAGLGVGAGVLVACQAHSFGLPGSGEWIEYRSLFVAWTAVAVLLLLMSFAASAWRPAFLAKMNLSQHFASVAARTWITAVSLLAAALVARSCSADIGGVRWSLGAVMALSLTAGAIALWLRSAGHVFFSGLLMNLAGVSAWFAWGARNAANFLEFQVFCLAAAATIWTLLDIVRRDCVPHFRLPEEDGGKPTPFAHLAIAAAIFALAVPTVYGVFGDLNGFGHNALRPARLDRPSRRRRRPRADALGSTAPDTLGWASISREPSRSAWIGCVTGFRPT